MTLSQLKIGRKEYLRKIKAGEIEKPKTMNPTEKAKANISSLRAAINAKCYDCSGFIKIDVSNCDMPDCELFKVRPWQRLNFKGNNGSSNIMPLRKAKVFKKRSSVKEIAIESLNFKGELLPPYANLKKNPKSLRKAINAYCFWCSCEQRKEVTFCPNADCPLYHVRPWQRK